MDTGPEHSEPHIRPSMGEHEFPLLVAIWRSAVDATHGFLADERRAQTEERLASDADRQERARRSGPPLPDPPPGATFSGI